MKRLPSQKNETYQSVIGRVFYLINRFFCSQKASLALGLVIFGVFVFSAINIRKLSTEYSMKQFYPQNHTILKTDSEIKKIFQVAEKSPFLYLVEMPSHLNWMDKSRIKKLQNLSNKLSDIQGVQQVVTMASIEGASQSKDQIAIGNFFDRTLVSNWKNEVKKNALIYPLFLSEDLRTTIVAVYTESTTSERLKQYDKVFKGYIQQHFPQTSITSGGVPVIQSQLSQLIRSELSLFFGVALLVFCLLFYMLFSHISAVIAAFLVLFISQVAAIGFLVPFGISMNVILSTLPIIISVSVMSLLIHTFHLWSEKQKLCDKMI